MYSDTDVPDSFCDWSHSPVRIQSFIYDVVIAHCHSILYAITVDVSRLRHGLKLTLTSYKTGIAASWNREQSRRSLPVARE